MNKILIGLFLLAAPLMFAQTDSPDEEAATSTEQVAPTKQAAPLEHRFYLTPFVGFADGGNIQIDDSQLTEGFKSVKISSGDIYGLRFGMRLQKWPQAQLEVSLSNQQTQVDDKDKLFAESPAGEFPAARTDTLDLKITNGQVALIWDLKSTPADMRQDGTLQPFVLAAIGVSAISATSPLPDENALNVSLGGGTRVWLSRNTALRFEVRGTWVDTDKGSSVTVPITNRDCEGECMRIYRYPNGFSLIEATVGFTWGYDQMPFLDKVFGRNKKSDD